MTLTTCKYVNGCERCARYKIQSQPAVGLKLLAVPEGPWQVVGTDLITGLPKCKGYDAIATYVDLYTKQVHICPTTKDVDSEGIADLHYKEVFQHHGIPTEFISDRGPQYVSKVMRALLKWLGIKALLTTAYHPQANGQTERMNREIAQYLRLFVNK